MNSAVPGLQASGSAGPELLLWLSRDKLQVVKLKFGQSISNLESCNSDGLGSSRQPGRRAGQSRPLLHPVRGALHVRLQFDSPRATAMVELYSKNLHP